MDFNATEKFIDRVSNLTLQLTFKKMTYDQSQLFENAIRIIFSFSNYLSVQG